MGVGSGRFAAALGIKTGIDPSVQLSHFAKLRGIDVFEGVAESLPFQEQQFDFVLFNTALCYVDLPLVALLEAKRVLKPNGKIIIGMIDKHSMLGQQYEATNKTTHFLNMLTFIQYPRFLNCFMKFILQKRQLIKHYLLLLIPS